MRLHAPGLALCPCDQYSSRHRNSDVYSFFALVLCVSKAAIDHGRVDTVLSGYGWPRNAREHAIRPSVLVIFGGTAAASQEAHPSRTHRRMMETKFLRSVPQSCSIGKVTQHAATPCSRRYLLVWVKGRNSNATSSCAPRLRPTPSPQSSHPPLLHVWMWMQLRRTCVPGPASAAPSTA